MSRLFFSLVLAVALGSCSADPARGAQSQAGAPARADLYACEGCEAVLERDPATMSSRARLAGPEEPGERQIVLGTVFRPDGKTPAEGVVVYAHHTDASGHYSRGTNESEWSRRHGLLRGWVRTGRDGRYVFETVKPGVYPDRSNPAHVHLMVREPGRPPYWVDEIVFSGEFGVTPAYRSRQVQQGGSGIVNLERGEGGVLVAKRDIVLERHPEP